VAALGFMLLVSLVASAAISTLGDFISARLPRAHKDARS
jgi:membrane protein